MSAYPLDAPNFGSYYQQLQQSQNYLQAQQQQAYSGMMALNARLGLGMMRQVTPDVDPVAVMPKHEPWEFAWLRERVEEILWRG